MAFLIPDNLGANKGVPDSIRRVARAFQSGLDEDVTVWYEPLFDPKNELPHLVVLEPRIGIIVLEVLKGKQGSVLGALRGRLRLDIDGEEVEVDSPLDRADRFAATLRERLSTYPPVADVPVGSVAVLSGLSLEEATSKKVGSVIDLDRTIFKPDLDAAITDGNGAAILRALRRSVSNGGSDDELTSDQLNVARGVIHPEVVVHPQPTRGALFTALVEDDVVKVMDRKQEAIAKSLGNGHRVLRGVAGSGKTLILVNRARLLAQLMPSQPILLTCFTKSLASQLRTHLADYDNVTVVNLDRLMAEVISKAGLKHPGFDGPSTPAQVALQALAKGGSVAYRAVLVDEAQDFDTDALQFCVGLLGDRSADEQDLVIVADSAQNIFRKNFRWKDAGIQAQGRTRILRVNYRNTRQVLEFAHGFLTADGTIGADEVPDDDDELTIIPAESSEREGSEPEVIVTASEDAEVAAVVDAVMQRLQNNSTARSIAVLYGEPNPGASSRGGQIAAALQSRKIDHFWVTDPNNQGNKNLAGSTDKAVVVSTIHSAKGLEYPSVIVCGAGARETSEQGRIAARKLIYVGMTRATHDLAVITEQGSPFRDSFSQLGP